MPQFRGHIRNWFGDLLSEKSEELEKAEEMRRFQDMVNQAMMANAQNNFNMQPGAPAPIAPELDMAMPGIMPLPQLPEAAPAAAPQTPPLIDVLDDEEKKKRPGFLGLLGMGLGIGG